MRFILLLAGLLLLASTPAHACFGSLPEIFCGGEGAETGQWRSGGFSGGSSAILRQARRDIGRNPTNWSRLWCAKAIGIWLRRAGYEGTGSAAALSYRNWGRPARPGPGAIGVMYRKGGGHVVVVKHCSATHCTVISPNHGRALTAVATYPRSRFIAFRKP